MYVCVVLVVGMSTFAVMPTGYHYCPVSVNI